MEKKKRRKALRLAIKALEKEYTERIWDAVNGRGFYAERCKAYCLERKEAITILEDMKKENNEEQ